MWTFTLRVGPAWPFCQGVCPALPAFAAGGPGNWAKGSVGSRTEPDSGGRLGCLHVRVEAGRDSWWSASGQAQVCENFGNFGGIFNSREDGQGATALWAGSDIDGKDAFE